MLFQIPGGPELFVIALTLFLLFGLPLVVAAGVYLYFRARSADDEADEPAATDDPSAERLDGG